MLLEKGVNPRVVQKLLGHADIKTTLNTYSHVLQEVYDGVANVLDVIGNDTINGKYAPVVGSVEAENVLLNAFVEV